MTNYRLKIIALVIMVIDHAGAILFPQVLLFRIIGRLAFPIFAFLIVQGFKHTRDVTKYSIRLLTFALVSEPFYDLAFWGEISLFNKQNIFFTLFLGLALIAITDLKDKGVYKKFPYIFYVLLIVTLAILIGADYGVYGILVIYLIYKRDTLKSLYKTLIPLNIGYVLLGGSMIQVISLVAFYPIYKYYDGQLGKRKKKIILYMYYPAHLLLLFMIKIVMG